MLPGGWRANYFEAITRSRLALGQADGARQAAAGAAAVGERTGTTFSQAMAARAAATVALDEGDAERAAEQALLAAQRCDAIRVALRPPLPDSHVAPLSEPLGA